MKNITTLFVFLFGILSLTYSQTVTIGTQVWMNKNLDVSTFRNGDPIPQAKTDQEWQEARLNSQPAWCYYDNEPANGAKYGKLYNWFAVNDSRGLAPAGYHIPTDAEWTTLEKYLGSDVSKKMKSTSGWKSHTTGGYKTCPNCSYWNAEYRKKVPCHKCKDTRLVKVPTITNSSNGSNSSGFTGLPGGLRQEFGKFSDIGNRGSWWSSTETHAQLATYRNLGYLNSISIKNLFSNTMKSSGFSVRCLRD
jgi:uncharacterized protein (TIGR02145 family)